ncbi:MAG: glycosyltransferase family 4 protein [Candidatus Pacearchaeota archaeon]
MKSYRRKLLFLSPLPPPYYGSAISSKACLKILENSKDFEVRNIKLNYSKSVSDVGTPNTSKFLGFFEVKKQIKKQLKEFSPDIVYFVPATSGLGLIRDYFFVKEIKKHVGKGKILFHVRSRTINSLLNNKLYKKMFFDEKAIVLGEQLVEDVSDYIPKKNIFVLPNAIKNEISEKKFKEILEERKKKKRVDILFISNMDKSKGWPKLLQACKILKKKGFDFKCNFVGGFQKEKDKEEFKEFVKNNNLEKEINYLGKKTGKEKNKILKKSDVLVFPTEYKLETFGRVILEGMMFGLPVIANSIASIPSIVEDKKTGFLLKENTPEEIAENIEKLAKDQKLREKMGKKGRQKFIKEFELEKYEKKLLEVLESSS